VLKSAPPEQIELLFDLMAASSKEKRAFLSDQMRDFFRELARAFNKKGLLRYRIAFAGNDAIAAVLSFYDSGYVYLYNTGFDPGQDISSPGFVAIALDIKSSIEAGDRYYDFLRGSERFKFNLGAEKRFMKRIQC
jgi:CelD/BcsL family acetyltransferase involved in cellulose biosynthesis